MEFVFFWFQRTDKMGLVVKGLMGQCPPPPPPPQHFCARTAPVKIPFGYGDGKLSCSSREHGVVHVLVTACLSLCLC